MSNELILQKWDELKVLVESLDVDIRKHMAGTKAAGVRARRGLRALKHETAVLVKLSVEHDKS